jgi:hypothetical protein
MDERLQYFACVYIIVQRMFCLEFYGIKKEKNNTGLRPDETSQFRIVSLLSEFR